MSDHFGTIPIGPVAPEPLVTTPRIERPQPKRPGKNKKHRTTPGFSKSVIVIAILLILTGSYLALGFWGIPKYIGLTLPDAFNKQTGLTLRLGHIQFSPFSFALGMNDITIYENNDMKSPLFSLQSFNTDLALLPLFKGEIIATHLALDTFEVNITRNSEGDYNFYPHSLDGKSAIPTTFPDLSNLPFRFSLNNISLDNGRITFQDKPNNNIHVVKEIRLTLPNLSNFSFQAKEYIHPSFSAIINGSPIQLTGQAALTGNSKDTNVSLKTELSCDFNAIDLNRYFNYLPFGLPFDVTNGKAEGTLKLNFSQSDKDNLLSVDFSMRATDMVMASADESFKFQVPSVKLEGSIQPLTGDTHLKSIELREPTTYISDAFSFANFKALASLTTAKNAENSNGANGPEVKIDQLLADSGTIILTGDSQKNERDRWQSIQLNLKNYSNSGGSSDPAKQGTFHLSGEQSGTRATFSWQGRIDEHLLPAGDLQLGNVSAIKLFTLLGLKDIHVQKGSADVQAYLSFKDYPDIELNDRITLSEGTLAFSDLVLKENDQVWYSTPTAKITGVSKQGKKLSLGSVYLKNSTMNLHTDSLPTLIRRFGAEKSSIGIEAVDFSGTLTLSNSARKLPELQFTQVSLQAINLSRLESSSERDNLTFTAHLGKTGEIQAKGKVRLNSFITTLTTGFSGIDSSQLLPWFGNNSLISDTTALLAGKGSFSFPYVSFNGQLLLENGTLGKKGKPYFSWSTIDLKDFRYNSEPLHLGASQCNIIAPKMSWTNAPDSRHIVLALSDFMQKNFQQKEKSPQNTKALPLLELQKLSISSASINFKDTRLSPSWKTEIDKLNGTIENVSSEATSPASRYTLTGQFATFPFSITGNMHLFDISQHGDAEFILNDFPFNSLHESVAKVLHVDARQGDVSVALNSSWDKGVLSHNGTLLFRNVKPQSTTADSALALALLADSDNSFSLSVKSEHALDKSPAPLITEGISEFQKLILKAAVSPLLLATGDFSDLIGEEYVEFTPGQILMTDKGQQSLARFSSLLSSHPQIGITLTGCADTAIDGEAMKKELENAEELRVAEENLRRSGALEKATEEYLLQVAEKRKAAGKTTTTIIEEKIPKDLYKRYAPIKPEKVVIDKSMLKNLATERERVIVEFLTEKLQLAPERISLAKKPVISNESDSQLNHVLFTVGTYTKP